MKFVVGIDKVLNLLTKLTLDGSYTFNNRYYSFSNSIVF
jgi:hypothetical protein